MLADSAHDLPPEPWPLLSSAWILAKGSRAFVQALSPVSSQPVLADLPRPLEPKEEEVRAHDEAGVGVRPCQGVWHVCRARPAPAICQATAASGAVRQDVPYSQELACKARAARHSSVDAISARLQQCRA